MSGDVNSVIGRLLVKMSSAAEAAYSNRLATLALGGGLDEERQERAGSVDTRMPRQKVLVWPPNPY